MKEIVFFSNFMGNGGAARVISTLAESLANKGYNVTICSFPKEATEYSKIKNVNYVLMKAPYIKGIRNRLERIRSIRHEIVKHKKAVIISFEYFMNMQTIIASLGLNNRVIVSERNDPSKMGGRFPIAQIRNILYGLCDKLVCQTPDAKDYFPQFIRKKTVIIPNPIKEHLPKPWTGKRDKRVVNFCRLEKQKNIPLLISAFSIFAKTHLDYHLDIFGDGKEFNSIQTMIEQQSLREMVTLHTSTESIHECIVKSSMFVSSSDYEGLSNSMLEAMAIGLPTICTDCPCGGAKMIIENEVNGILVPVGDDFSLANAMSRLADNAVFSNKISRNGSKIRERLQVENIVKYWEDVLND